MAYTLLPIPPTDITAAEAAPALLRLNALKVIESAVNSAPWLLEILRMRTRGELTLRATVFLTLYVLTEIGNRTPSPVWAHLALAEILGQVDVTTLTAPILQKLADDGRLIHFQATTGSVRVLETLSRYIAARKSATRQLYGPASEPYLPVYDRFATALAPILRG